MLYRFSSTDLMYVFLIIHNLFRELNLQIPVSVKVISRVKMGQIRSSFSLILGRSGWVANKIRSR